MEPHSTRSGGQGPESGVNPHYVQLQHEIELRRNAELRANNYQTQNRRLRDALKAANTYRIKVITMFLALSAHYSFMHDINLRLSSSIGTIERNELAREAYRLGCDTLQAIVAVQGTENRQSYLHDLVYGAQKLFLRLGKPYLGATEGNEHAHQEMKKDFHQMCSYSNKNLDSMLQLMNLLTTCGEQCSANIQDLRLRQGSQRGGSGWT